MNWQAQLLEALGELHGWQAQRMPQYAPDLESVEERDPRLFANLLTLAQQLPVGRTLDVGGGAGIGAAILCNLGHRVVLLDPAGWCYGQAELAARWGFEVVRDNAEPMPFADATFDNVFCHHALEHVPAPLFALCECSRVTKAGGWLALGVPPPAVNTACSSHLSDFSAVQLSYLLAVTGYHVGDISQRSYDLRLTAQKVDAPFAAGIHLRDLRDRVPEAFYREEEGRVWLCDEYRAPGNLHCVTVEGP